MPFYIGLSICSHHNCEMEWHRRVDLKHQAWTLCRSPLFSDLGYDKDKKSLDDEKPSLENIKKRRIGKKEAEPHKSLKVSTFIPPGFAQRLGWLDPSHYLLCVGYAERGDYQLGISGTCWRGEDEEATLEREVQEETGLLLKSSPSFEHFGIVRRFSPRFRKPRTYAYFGITPSTLAPGGFPYIPEERVNDKARKIVALIHGPLEEIRGLMTAIRDQPGFATDGIDRYAAISVEDAIDLVTHLPSMCDK